MYIRNTRSPRQNASTTPEEKNNAAERGQGRDSSSSSRYSARSQNKQYFAARGIGDLYVARPTNWAAFDALILQSYVYIMSAHDVIKTTPGKFSNDLPKQIGSIRLFY